MVEIADLDAFGVVRRPFRTGTSFFGALPPHVAAEERRAQGAHTGWIAGSIWN